MKSNIPANSWVWDEVWCKLANHGNQWNKLTCELEKSQFGLRGVMFHLHYFCNIVIIVRHGHAEETLRAQPDHTTLS